MSSSDDSGGAEATPVVPVICGPTASGKSEIAMWLAQRYPVEIISADSRQIYRGFDVGTSKPVRAELERVPHHGIDVANPTERFSAAAWSDLAQRAIASAIACRRVPLVVGGTGFYIASLFSPLWDQPFLDPGKRQAVQGQLERFSLEELRRWCAALDPSRAGLGRAQLLRAVEVALLTGQRLSALHVSRARPPVWSPRYLVVDPGTELHARIAARAAAMLESGWVDEVTRLSETTPPDAPAWNATGYETVRRHVAGELGRTEMLEQIVTGTRQYAKRQRTWLRHQLEPEHVTRVSLASGWQEVVDRWIGTCRLPHDAAARSA